MWVENSISLTRHAQNKAQKRAINKNHINLHMQYADQDCHIGDGMISETLSPEAINILKTKGISTAIQDKLKNVAIIYGTDGSIVTVLHIFKGQGRRYTRGSFKRSSNC